jgi:hypothetical protein
MADPWRIRQLLSEIGEGVACRHYHEPRTGIDFDLLASFGLLNPIKTRIPACADHGCPLLGQCQHQADFDPGANPRMPKGNRKFRRAPEGAAVAVDAGLLARLASEHRLAGLVASALRDGKASIFALAEALLELDLAQLEAEGASEPAVRRRELGAYLRLLEALGWLRFDDDGLTVRAFWPPADRVSPRRPGETG